LSPGFLKCFNVEKENLTFLWKSDQTEEINFINILQPSFEPIFFRQKFSNPNCN
jgi:hypothetical protein